MFYIVATPIGNLSDMSSRAIDTLRECDYILCEDTRTSMTLLKHYDISNKLVSYHKFNEASKCDSIAQDLMNGKNIALISDAGMPGISDPGAVVVRYLRDRHIPYTVVPGPSALINAFVLSGYDAPFTFVGFLPEKNRAKRELLNRLATLPYPSIFYVSPHSIEEFFQDVYEVYGNRDVCVVRELTKKFEQVEFTDLATGYTGAVKGEFVVVVQGKEDDNIEIDKDTIVAELEKLVDSGVSKKDASKVLAEKYNIKKNYVYNLSIK
ncbi:MAG: 16S rRNA (cytidine(1402)-2'-O)-methyltransferase [Clostridiales bacterium]|nr:16S rRNA (cytidine(1402)-2'-O)-methyltransferase [Clostridiales bacterium]